MQQMMAALCGKFGEIQNDYQNLRNSVNELANNTEQRLLEQEIQAKEDQQYNDDQFKVIMVQMARLQEQLEANKADAKDDGKVYVPHGDPHPPAKIARQSDFARGTENLRSTIGDPHLSVEIARQGDSARGTENLDGTHTAGSSLGATGSANA